jgi:predicted AAA+ superfamily ATPase
MTMMTTPPSRPGETPYVGRVLDVATLLARKTHFLLGPRQTGKTSLVQHALPEVPLYDLLDHSTYLTLSRDPGRLAQELDQGQRAVVIDEVQRLPALLNEVHRLIETRGIRFLLTGSSARKLRRGGVNLLGGRARMKYLHPLIARELGDRFDLDRALERGLLPSVYLSDDPHADLEAYAGTYLQQEVVAEGATRNVPAFSRFLRVAAVCNATVVNFTAVASEAQVARTTVYEYFDILRDTLLLHELPPWRRSVKRKPLASSKYYFFDPGVAGYLQGRRVQPGTPEYGAAFETYLMHELRSWSDYASGEPIAFWRSASGFEVDFIIGDHTAVEAKAKASVSDRDLRSLRALAEEAALARYVCVCLEPRPRTVDGVAVLPYREFLDRLWGGELPTG